MASKKEIDEHLKIALKEVGKIKPWFDEEVDAWIFSHPAYPVECGGDSLKEVVKNYPLYLREFIKHRLDHTLASFVEKKTKGRGGVRSGSGRPKGSKKTAPKKVVRLDIRAANWAKTHENEIIHILSGDLKVVSVRKRKKLPPVFKSSLSRRRCPAR